MRMLMARYGASIKFEKLHGCIYLSFPFEPMFLPTSDVTATDNNFQLPFLGEKWKETSQAVDPIVAAAAALKTKHDDLEEPTKKRQQEQIELELKKKKMKLEKGVPASATVEPTQNTSNTTNDSGSVEQVKEPNNEPSSSHSKSPEEQDGAPDKPSDSSKGSQEISSVLNNVDTPEEPQLATTSPGTTKTSEAKNVSPDPVASIHMSNGPDTLPATDEFGGVIYYV